MVGRPWRLVLIVCGFLTKHAALAFESAWQQPHTSRHLRRMWHACGEGRCNGRTSVKTRLRALCILLEHGVWAQQSLAIRLVPPRPPERSISGIDWASAMLRVCDLVPVASNASPRNARVVELE